ncbi:MAG: hypothetical protein ACRD2J_10790, partial [Thermoanaerobaculia bacterium]
MKWTRVAVVPSGATNVDVEAAMVGAPESRLIVTLRVVVPPCEVAVQVKVVPFVSVVTADGSQPELPVRSVSTSWTVHDRSTVPARYQPLSPSLPVTTGVITGPVTSADEQLAAVFAAFTVTEPAFGSVGSAAPAIARAVWTSG